MVYEDFDDDIHRFARGIIRRKVKQLIGRAGFTNQDREDLEHDFFVRLLQSLRLFNPDQGHCNAFITAVIERYVATILRDRQAEKRDHRRVTSLNVRINLGEDENAELAETIGQRELDAQRGRYPRSNEELSRLAQDLAEFIAKLPANLKELAERLKTETVSEIARDMDIPRTTLDARVRKLQKRFEKAGLRNYL